MSKLLIVDDEDMIRMNLVVFLEDEGYEVEEARTAEEALERIGLEVFDCVIVDLRLPGRDGAELIAIAEQKYAYSKFLIHTGSAEFKIPPNLARIGITNDDILQKPLPDMHIIKEKIADIIKRVQGSQG